MNGLKLTQPEALRLADYAFAARDGWWHTLADAELRRLHEVNVELVEALTRLLDTARPMSNAAYNIGQSHPRWESQIYPAIKAFDAASLQAKAAIAKATGGEA